MHETRPPKAFLVAANNAVGAMSRRPVLSAREIQMLTHVARGLSNFQIAQAEYVSAETVKTHLYNAFRKLRAVNRAHAVAIAYHVGIFAPGASLDHAVSPLSPRRRSPARRLLSQNRSVNREPPTE
ncbi:hypothetical protein DMP23_21230 [Amycolatopsis sp. A1MSW2902]|uniref:response regulator transcription factor n=1 Tax=Amycolatopsis sp. A1MSW2902 TaxID=687413 RepID=UPI00307E6066